jgi:hypothetical protein
VKFEFLRFQNKIRSFRNRILTLLSTIFKFLRWKSLSYENCILSKIKFYSEVEVIKNEIWDFFKMKFL